MDDDVTQEILKATYRTLGEQGYAHLTLQDIADNAEVSKASIHYHFNTKDDLFREFLDFLNSRFLKHIGATTGETYQAQLLSLLDMLLTAEEGGTDSEFQIVLLELRAQTPYNDVIRKKFEDFDALLFESLRAVIAAGIDAGEFRESIGPDLIAELLTACVVGGQTRLASDGYSPDHLATAVQLFVVNRLVAENGPDVHHS